MSAGAEGLLSLPFGVNTIDGVVEHAIALFAARFRLVAGDEDPVEADAGHIHVLGLALPLPHNGSIVRVPRLVEALDRLRQELALVTAADALQLCRRLWLVTEVRTMDSATVPTNNVVEDDGSCHDGGTEAIAASDPRNGGAATARRSTSPSDPRTAYPFTAESSAAAEPFRLTEDQEAAGEDRGPDHGAGGGSVS